MSSDESNDFQLDQYLDGLMSPQDSADFLRTVDSGSLETTKSFQRRIDDSLRRLVATEPLNEVDIERRFVEAHNATQTVEPAKKVATGLLSQSWVRVAVAAAVLLAASLGIWFSSGPNIIEPDFNPRSLASIYTETVDRGFRPYYVCDDDVRFAETFQTRLGQALALAELPANSEMLGISYLGGISRKATAMLCRVDGQNVLIVVARVGEPGEAVATADVDGDGLNIFVAEKNGLVFCEVTPLESSQMIEHFRFMD